MAYTNIVGMGDVGITLKGKQTNTATELVILSDIAIVNFSVKDNFTLLPIDYQSAGSVWKRYYLDYKHAYPFSFHGGTISLQFLSKLKTKQPIFNFNIYDQYWLRLYPTVAATDPLPSVTTGTYYYGATVISAEMSQKDVGDKKVMAGSLTFQYKYKEYT